jgi:hypothetical protein
LILNCGVIKIRTGISNTGTIKNNIVKARFPEFALFEFTVIRLIVKDTRNQINMIIHDIIVILFLFKG